MINSIIRLVIIALQIIIIQACGYRLAEDDKYPNMTIYPQTSNNNYVIDSLFETNNQIKYTEQYMYCVTNEKSKNDLISVYLNILDKELNIVKKIQVSSSLSHPIRYNIDSANNIYFIGDNEKLYKCTYPWKEPLELSQIFDNEETDTIANIKKEQLYDRNNCILPIDDNKTNRYIVLNDSLGKQSYIVMRDDKLIWEMFYSKEAPRCDSLIYYNTYFNSTESPNLTLEQAAFGNNSSGNHFVFEYIPYGYDYYTITVNNDTIRFKIDNDNLNYPMFRQIGSRFTNKILLLTKNHILCLLRKK